LLTLDVERVKFVSHYKYLGIVLDIELWDDKDIQKQLRYQYYAINKTRASFSRCSNTVKNALFHSFCTSMYASQFGVISGRHTSTECVWPRDRVQGGRGDTVACNYGCRTPYNLSLWAIVSSYQVQCNISTIEALLRKNVYIFLEQCKKSNNVWLPALMQNHIAYTNICPYSLNNTIAFYFVIECSDVRVLVWWRVQATTHSYFTRP